MRALYNACFFKLFLAAEIEPVLCNVFDAASIAVVHFLPVFVFLPPLIFLVWRFLEARLRLVAIIYNYNIKYLITVLNI